MEIGKERLREIFEKTNGKCHLCHKPLAFRSHGKNTPNGWEIEHSVPKARGGTDHLNNLYAAHPSCNRAKGTMTSRTARIAHGRRRAPLSRKRLIQERLQNTVVGSTFGGLIAVATGLALAPIVVVGGLVGLLADPEG